MTAPPLHGVVLAGGRSRRYGQDKAALRIDGVALLERAVTLLGEFTSDVRVAVSADQCDDKLRRQFSLVTDVAAGLGPAAGLLAARQASPESAWLVLACDMPGIDRRVLTLLVAARDPSAGATAFRDPASRLPEPLCAIFEPATLAKLAAEVAAGGKPGPSALLAGCQAKLLDPPPESFFGSINTPEDLAGFLGGGRLPPVDSPGH